MKLTFLFLVTGRREEASEIGLEEEKRKIQSCHSCNKQDLSEHSSFAKAPFGVNVCPVLASLNQFFFFPVKAHHFANWQNIKDLKE